MVPVTVGKNETIDFFFDDDETIIIFSHQNHAPIDHSSCLENQDDLVQNHPPALFFTIHLGRRQQPAAAAPAASCVGEEESKGLHNIVDDRNGSHAHC